MSAFQPDTLIKNPQACQVETSVEVAADAARVWAVVPAAGRGTRFGGDLPKQYLVVDGAPLIAQGAFQRADGLWVNKRGQRPYCGHPDRDRPFCFAGNRPDWRCTDGPCV